MIQFFLNQQQLSLDADAPHLSVLQWLRTNSELLGSKEGCASGDCGACTVVIGSLDQNNADGVRYHTANACITPMTALQGKQLLTVEHVAHSPSPSVQLEQLHPVQRAMVDCHGSQCGFCTPGFIMSLFALYLNYPEYPGRATVIEALGGNLCRCTGYQPILKAAEQAYAYPRQTMISADICNELEALALNIVDSDESLVPQNLAQLLAYDASAKSVKWIAGGTDLSLEFTQQLKSYDAVLNISHIEELKQLKLDDEDIIIGAALPYSDFLPSLLSYYPSVAEVFERLGSLQVRNQATLGGSLANASPIGDPAPLLLALDARLVLTSLRDDQLCNREIALADFFIGYRNTVLAEGEVIRSIIIPKPCANSETFFYKISKRLEDDISAVCLALHIEVEDGNISQARCALGGMAATPIKVAEVAEALVGKPCNEQSFEAAAIALAANVQPIADVRASAEYRQSVAANLLRRAWFETQACHNNTVVRVQHA